MSSKKEKCFRVAPNTVDDGFGGPEGELLYRRRISLKYLEVDDCAVMWVNKDFLLGKSTRHAFFEDLYGWPRRRDTKLRGEFEEVPAEEWAYCCKVKEG